MSSILDFIAAFCLLGLFYGRTNGLPSTTRNGNMDFIDCSGSPTVFTVKDVYFSPYPMTPNTYITAYLGFNSSKEIKNDAQVTVIVKGFSLSFKKTFNFCSILPNDESCPLTEGRHVFAYRKLLPFYVPKNTYRVYVKGDSSTGGVLFCTVLDIMVV